MSIAIVNLTGNLRGIEDKFAAKLSSLTNKSMLISLRGEEALDFDPITISPDTKILVLVCHGERDMDDTRLDIGLDMFPYSDNNYFSSPYLISTFTHNIRSYYIVFYCVCFSLSSNSIVAFDDKNCLGTISNIIEVYTTYFAEIACLLNQIHDVLTTGGNKENIISGINNIMNICRETDGLKSFIFTENLVVTEIEE